MGEAVHVIDVAPRDGFQAVSTWIPTKNKICIIQALIEANFQRIEAGAFVNPAAIPQMADTAIVHETVRAALIAGKKLRLSALVPNLRGAEDALASDITDLVYVVSASETHNNANVRRPVQASLDELQSVIKLLENRADPKLRVNIATAFDCPYEGRVGVEAVKDIIHPVAASGMAVEVALCDTTGRAFPDQVASVFRRCFEAFSNPSLDWCFHGHDTYGLGLSNALSAYEAGVRIFDAAAAGLGGCPFAPGASGNTASEDLVFMFHNMGIDTGINLGKLLDVADMIAELPDMDTGGHVRHLPRKRVL